MYTRLEVQSHCFTSIPSASKDFRIYASDGSSRCFHKNLLTKISPELLKLIGSIDPGGSSGLYIPVVCPNGLQALYDLIYTGRSIILSKNVKKVCAQLRALKVLIKTRDGNPEDEDDEGYSGAGDPGFSTKDEDEDLNEEEEAEVEEEEEEVDVDVDIDEEGEDDAEEDEVDDDETKGMIQDTKDIIRITRYIRKILPRASTFQTSPESFECFICFKSLCNSAVWANHLMAQHFYQNFSCPDCGKKFNYFNVFNQHLYKFHGYRTNNPFKESPGRRKSN